jgi:hypothetical protein
MSKSLRLWTNLKIDVIDPKGIPFLRPIPLSLEPFRNEKGEGSSSEKR